jgi:hypothetical protein
MHLHEDGRFLEDKYFWSFLITDLKGELMEKVEEGKNIWMTEEEYREREHTFGDFDEIAEVLESDQLVYVERKWVVDSY